MPVDVPGDRTIAALLGDSRGQLLIGIERVQYEFLLLEVKVCTRDGLHLDIRSDTDSSGVPSAQITRQVDLDTLEQQTDVDLSETDTILKRV